MADADPGEPIGKRIGNPFMLLSVGKSYNLHCGLRVPLSQGAVILSECECGVFCAPHFPAEQ
jgi:hypothetical protein